MSDVKPDDNQPVLGELREWSQYLISSGARGIGHLAPAQQHMRHDNRKWSAEVMADTEDFDAHRQAHSDRAMNIVDAVYTFLTDDGPTEWQQAGARDVAVVTIDALSASFRAYAERVRGANRKGHVGITRELLRVAEEVTNVGLYLRALTFDTPAVTTIPEIVTLKSTDIATRDMSSGISIRQNEDHMQRDTITRDKDGVFILGRREPGATLTGHVAGGLDETSEEVFASDTDAATAAMESVTAYLKGDTDALPHAIIARLASPDTLPLSVTDNLPDVVVGVDGSPEPISKEESLTMLLESAQYAPMTREDDPVTSNLHVGTPVYAAPLRAPLDQDLFAGMKPPAYEGFAMADLRKPVAMPPEDGRHLSVSSVGEYVECGLAFRLKRRETGITETPAWWNVGGSAFHAAIERLETVAAMGGWGSSVITDMCQTMRNSEAPWLSYLHAEMDKTETATGTPSAQFRAAKGGKEAYDWWRVEGHDMIKRYIDNRDPSRCILRLPDNDGDSDWPAEPQVPAIEYAFLLDVEGVPMKGKVDQAWHANALDAIMIEDLKAGASKPSDTFQLGVYAHAMLAQLREIDNPSVGNAPIRRAFGRYYMARTGEFTPTVNLLDAHPWDEIVYRVHQVDQGDRAGIYPARTSGLGGGPCNMCSAKRACPIGGKA